MGCPRLATSLDQEMLEVARDVQIAPAFTSDEDLSDHWRKTGVRVAEELGGRYLIRYSTTDKNDEYKDARAGRFYTTPTPYSSKDTIDWLCLPHAGFARTYFSLFDPSKIHVILGPRWIRLGDGIEYVLSEGFEEDALVTPEKVHLS